MELAVVGFGAIIMMSIVVPPLAWCFGVARRWSWRYESRQILSRHNTIVAEYDPPHHLSPAQIAYLYDQTFGAEEILATLFDLEQRGYLKLHGTQSAKDFVVTVQRSDGKHLESYEHELLLHIKHMRGVTRWNNILHELENFTSAFEAQLAESLRAKGLLLIHEDIAIRHKALWVAAGMCNALIIFLPVYGIGQQFQSNDLGAFAALDRSISILPLLLLWFISTVITGFSIRYALELHMRALRMKQGTGLLRFMWPQIEGYRLFLLQVELNQIQFENQTMRAVVRNHTLPYAIALNLSTRWHDRFRVRQ